MQATRFSLRPKCLWRNEWKADFYFLGSEKILPADYLCLGFLPQPFHLVRFVCVQRWQTFPFLHSVQYSVRCIWFKQEESPRHRHIDRQSEKHNLSCAVSAVSALSSRLCLVWFLIQYIRTWTVLQQHVLYLWQKNETIVLYLQWWF